MVNKSLSNIQLSKEDQSFLQKIVDSMNFTIVAFPQQIIGIKDINSLHVYCSPYYLEQLELSNHQIEGQLIVGSIYQHILCPNKIKEEDNLVISQTQPLIFLKILKLKNEISPKIVVKSPLINPTTNNCVGLIYHGIDYGTIDFNKQILNIHNHFQQEASWDNFKVKLTKREKQVIFFFLANLNSQEIADLIYKLENKKIAKSTIDSLFVDRLFPKFKVYNRQALYKKLIELSFDRLIPQEVLININASYPIKQHQIY